MLSVVVPVFNEAESLRLLHDELEAALQGLDREVEFLLVDDGSTDASWRMIAQLAREDQRVRGIRLRRNFGKAAALSAGFQAAAGRAVVTLDADLQDDPQEIPRLLEMLDDGLDVVSGWKRVRHDPWHKVGPSRVFNWLVSRVTGAHLHDHNCGLKAYRREVLDEVHLYGELHRFVPVLAHARGFRIGETEVRHRPRRFGQSKYGVRRFVKGFLDLMTVKFLTGFGQRPQHLLGTVGLLCFLAGTMGLMYLTGYWVAARLHPEWQLLPLHQRPAVLYSLGSLLLGAQLMSMGFLAELITAYHLRERDTFSVAERLGTEPAAPRREVNRAGPLGPGAFRESNE